jgi:hypothetical protein
MKIAKNGKEVAQEILDGARRLTSLGGAEPCVWVRPYSLPRDSMHQFVIFLKPEVTASGEGVDVRGVLDILIRVSESWNLAFGAIRLLSGRYLGSNQLMDAHYGVINRISRNGQSAISRSAAEALQETFKEDIDAGAKVVGGHQFLNAYPQFSSAALSVITDNVGTKKLAGGTYALPLRVFGQRYIVLNPFHPYQLEAFTGEDKSIFAFEGRSKTSWPDLRRRFTGATDPKKASDGSVRAELLKDFEKLGIQEISQGSNGIHVSAGPLEGMVELQRFFSDPTLEQALTPAQTCFGRDLLSAGMSDEIIKLFSENHIVNLESGPVSAFDLTEELDSREGVRRLAEASSLVAL